MNCNPTKTDADQVRAHEVAEKERQLADVRQRQLADEAAAALKEGDRLKELAVAEAEKVRQESKRVQAEARKCQAEAATARRNLQEAYNAALAGGDTPVVNVFALITFIVRMLFQK